MSIPRKPPTTAPRPIWRACSRWCQKAEISQLQFDSYVAAARVAEASCRRRQERLRADQDKAASDRAAVVSAQAKVAEARAAVAQSRANRKQVAVSAAQAASAAAAVQQARANLEAAELHLSYTTIVAPMDGVVTKKAVELGQIVQPGQAFMTLVPLNDVWVTANFKETQLADVRPGQHAEVKVDMYGRTFAGQRGFHRRRHRRAHEPAAAGERHRQLRQSGAAHSGEDRPRPAPGGRTCCVPA